MIFASSGDPEFFQQFMNKTDFSFLSHTFANFKFNSNLFGKKTTHKYAVFGYFPAQCTAIFDCYNFPHPHLCHRSIHLKIFLATRWNPRFFGRYFPFSAVHTTSTRAVFRFRLRFQPHNSASSCAHTHFCPAKNPKNHRKNCCFSRDSNSAIQQFWFIKPHAGSNINSNHRFVHVVQFLRQISNQNVTCIRATTLSALVKSL